MLSLVEDAHDKTKQRVIHLFFNLIQQALESMSALAFDLEKSAELHTLFAYHLRIDAHASIFIVSIAVPR